MSTSLPSFGELLDSLGVDERVRRSSIPGSGCYPSPADACFTRQHQGDKPTHGFMNHQESVPRIAHSQQHHYHQGSRRGRGVTRFTPYLSTDQIHSRRNSLSDASGDASDDNSTISSLSSRRSSRTQGSHQYPTLTELRIPACAPISSLLRQRHSPQTSPTSPLFVTGPSSTASTTSRSSPATPLTLPTIPTLPLSSFTTGKSMPSSYHRNYVRSRHRGHSRNWSTESANSLASAVSSLSVSSNSEKDGIRCNARTRSASPGSTDGNTGKLLAMSR